MIEREILRRLLVKSEGYECPACGRLFNSIRGYWAHAGWHMREWRKVKSPHKGLSLLPCPVCGKRIRWSKPYILEKLKPYHVKCWFCLKVKLI